MNPKISFIVLGCLPIIIFFSVQCAPAPAAPAATSVPLAVPPSATTTSRPVTVPASLPVVILERGKFNFPPKQDGSSRIVTRMVKIDASKWVDKNNRDLDISTAPLPADPPSPPRGKGIDKFIVAVIEPQIRVKGTNETVVNFDPSFTLSIDFSSDDFRAAPLGADGKPQFSIVTFYKAGNDWRWERLPTTVTCKERCDQGGTLAAELKTLQPNDPIGEGAP